MNLLRCDACGDDYQIKNGGGQLAIGIRAPKGDAAAQAGDAFMAKLLGAPDRTDVEEHRFDLCYECALSMALALKKQRADLRAGRRPV